jgi:putative hydrolase of the HAD superfamily
VSRTGSASAPSALLLDALGTLVALRPPAPRLQAELAARFGVAISPAEADRAIAAEISYYRSHLDDGRDPAALADLRERCAEALRRALPPTPELARVGTPALTGALLASLQFEPFADARPVLEAAHAAGRRLVVVSNWDVSLHEVLARLGLAPLLDGIVTSAEAGARKPAVEIFSHALEIAGAGAADAIHVGDSVEEDVVGARAAEIEPVLVRRDGSPGPDGVRTITTLTELLR